MHASLWLVSLLPGLFLAAARPAEPIARIDEGVAAIGKGEYRSALVTLDGAAQDLSARPEAKLDLARAYLYLGVAYSQLGEKSLANSRFLRALDLDPDLTKRHADAIRGLPVAARDALVKAVEEHRRLLANQAGAKKRSWTGLVLLGGAGAAAGAGLALAREEEVVTVTDVEQQTVTAPERTNHPPQATINVSPAGAAMACLTTFVFTASASDPDGEPLRFEWDLGEGQTATGATATHRFTSGGTKQVTLRVFDGLTSVTATTQLAVKPLEGRWRLEERSLASLEAVEFLRVDRESCSAPGLVRFYAVGTHNGAVSPNQASGLARRPTRIEFQLRWYDQDVYLYFLGDLDASLDRLSGTLFEAPYWGACALCGRPVTLVREQ